MQNDDLTPFIINEHNKLITTEFINNILKKYNINFSVKNIDNFNIAMTHISYLIRDNNFKGNKAKQYQQQIGDVEPIDDIRNGLPLRTQSYERLEFLGDAIIHAVLAEYLYKRYHDEDEGFMTKLRTKIENGDTLSQLARSLNMHEYVVISRYIEKLGSREKNNHIIEDIFEAFIGALFIEAGFEICRKFLTELIEKEIDFANLLYVETNFKDKLLQYFHKMKWEDPKYGDLDISGPENKKIYTMYVKCVQHPNDKGKIVGTGCANSKKKGEQEAAKNALIYFGCYDEIDDDSDSEIIINYNSDDDFDVIQSDSDDE